MTYKKKYSAYLVLGISIVLIPILATLVLQHLSAKYLKKNIETLLSLEIDFKLEPFAFLKSSARLESIKLKSAAASEEFLSAPSIILHFNHKNFLLSVFSIRGIEIIEPQLFPQNSTLQAKKVLDPNSLIYYLRDMDKVNIDTSSIDKSSLSSFKFLQKESLDQQKIEEKLQEIFVRLPKATDLNIHKKKMPLLKPGKELEQFQADINYKKGIFPLVKEQSDAVFKQAEKNLERLKVYIARDALLLKASADPYSLSDEEMNSLIFMPRIESYLNSLQSFFAFTQLENFQFIKLIHNKQEYILDFSKPLVELEMQFDFSKFNQYGSKFKFVRKLDSGLPYYEFAYEFSNDKVEEKTLIQSKDVNVGITQGANQFKLQYKNHPAPNQEENTFVFSDLFYQSTFLIKGNELEKANDLEKVLNQDGRFVLHFERDSKQQKLSSNFASMLRKTFFSFQTQAAQELMKKREKEIELLLKPEMEQKTQSLDSLRKFWTDKLNQSEVNFAQEVSQIAI
jgi:uncharacterized protein (DUF2132 family)